MPSSGEKVTSVGWLSSTSLPGAPSGFMSPWSRGPSPTQVVAHHGLDQAVGGDPADPVVLPVEQVRRCRRWGRSRGPSASTARSPGGRSPSPLYAFSPMPAQVQMVCEPVQGSAGIPGSMRVRQAPPSAARPPAPRRAARGAHEVSISCRQPAARSWPSCRTPREPRQLTPSPPPTPIPRDPNTPPMSHPPPETRWPERATR